MGITILAPRRSSVIPTVPTGSGNSSALAPPAALVNEGSAPETTPAAASPPSLTLQPNEGNFGDFCQPAPVFSVHSECHVSATLKSKIINGQYVDLGQLLDNQQSENAGRRLELSQNGEIVLKASTPGRVISTIESWTDAFLIYASIFLSVHPHRSVELLKYASNIRLASGRHQGPGWRQYDQQFRLRVAADPAGVSFGHIDQELWLLYVGASASTGTFSQPTYAAKKCYDFNYRSCSRMQCTYKHACMICNAAHPSRSCAGGRDSWHGGRGAGPVRASVSQGRRGYGPRSRTAFRGGPGAQF